MCKQSNQFKLCSCSDIKTKIVHNKNSRRYKNKLPEQKPKKIIWTLSKCEGSQYLGMDGMLIGPASKLTEKLTANYVKEELNTRNCFDFDYSPKEGDNLVLTPYLTKKESLKQEYEFLSFIFNNGQWILKSYNVFYDKVIEFKKGKLEFKENKL